MPFNLSPSLYVFLKSQYWHKNFFLEGMDCVKFYVVVFSVTTFFFNLVWNQKLEFPIWDIFYCTHFTHSEAEPLTAEFAVSVCLSWGDLKGNQLCSCTNIYVNIQCLPWSQVMWDSRVEKSYNMVCGAQRLTFRLIGF